MNRTVNALTPLVSRQTRGGRLALSLAGIAVLLMISMHWWADVGLTRSVVEFSCYLALAAMWNLLAGYAGMVSIGQQAFLGIAAYGMFVRGPLCGRRAVSCRACGASGSHLFAAPAAGGPLLRDRHLDHR